MDAALRILPRAKVTANARANTTLPPHAVERKGAGRAQSVTMPVLLENAAWAFMSLDASIERLRKYYGCTRRAALEAVLACLCCAVGYGPDRGRRAA